MYIYLLLINVIYFILYVGQKSPNISRKTIALFLILVMTLFASLRGDVGTDTGTYLLIFDNFKYNEDYVYEKYEPGFYFVIQLLNKLNFPSFSLTMTLGFIQGFLLYSLVRRSSNPLLFLAIYIGLFYFNFSFNILRASIAILSTILAISYAIEGKIGKTFLYAFIAVMFHVSSLFFLLPFYIFRSKYKLIYSLILALSLSFFTIDNYFYDKLIYYIRGMSSVEFRFSIIFLPLIIFFFFLLNRTNEKNKYIFFLLIFDIFIRIITMFFPIVGRLEMFISFAFIYFVIDRIKDRKVSEIVILFGYILTNIVIFSFEITDINSVDVNFNEQSNSKFIPYSSIFN